MKGSECEKFRESIRASYANDDPQEKPVRDHMRKCASCRKYALFIASYGRRLKDQLDRKVADMPDPDVEKLALLGKKKVRKKRLIVNISGIAAVVICTAGTLFAAVQLSEKQKHNVFREEVFSFVDDLFEAPPLDETGFFITGE